MPLHTCTAARSHSYLFVVLREPRVRRRLPQQVFDRIEAGRLRNEPYRYTSGDIRAIATHVSRPAVAEPIDPRVQKHRECLEWRRQYQLGQEGTAVRRAEHDQQQRTLEERLSRPKLADRITEPTYTPIAPKPIVIDFARVNTADLIGIFKPKIATTITRLKPIIELADHWENATPDQRRAFESLADKIQSFGFDLEQRAPAITRAQWQSLDWGLKEIGKVSFVGLRRNYQSVLSRLVVLSGQGYFEWL